MKRFQLLKLLPLVAVVFAAACTDATTAPATSSKAITAADIPVSFLTGNEPPPPVDASIAVCAGSDCVVVNGKYNAKGGIEALALIADEVLDIEGFAAASGECSQPGTAWLKFEKGKKPKHHKAAEVKVDGKARIKCKDEEASGNGKIEFKNSAGEKVVVMLRGVRTFDNTQKCAMSPMACASFTADVTVGGTLIVGGAQGAAFNQEFFDDNSCDPFLEYRGKKEKLILAAAVSEP